MDNKFLFGAVVTLALLYAVNFSIPFAAIIAIVLISIGFFISIFSFISAIVYYTPASNIMPPISQAVVAQALDLALITAIYLSGYVVGGYILYAAFVAKQLFIVYFYLKESKS